MARELQGSCSKQSRRCHSFAMVEAAIGNTTVFEVTNAISDEVVWQLSRKGSFIIPFLIFRSLCGTSDYQTLMANSSSFLLASLLPA